MNKSQYQTTYENIRIAAESDTEKIVRRLSVMLSLFIETVHILASSCIAKSTSRNSIRTG